MDDKIIIKIKNFEEGDLEMISMITKLLEDYVYSFVSFDRRIEITKEKSNFVIKILNTFGDKEQIGEISITHKEYVWNIRPHIDWEYEISGIAYLEDEDGEDFYLQMRSSFLKLLRKLVDYREAL